MFVYGRFADNSLMSLDGVSNLKMTAWDANSLSIDTSVNPTTVIVKTGAKDVTGTLIKLEFQTCNSNSVAANGFIFGDVSLPQASGVSLSSTCASNKVTKSGDAAGTIFGYSTSCIINVSLQFAMVAQKT